MKTWKLLLEYDGTRYSGWQEQINARTVAGVIRAAAEEFFESPIELMGSGRTDAGVHALGQVAHVKLRKSAKRHREYHPAELVREFNHRLPADISILSIHEAPPGFHARHSALSRAYLYQISQRKTAFEKKHVWWVKEKLNLDRMAEAAALLPGRHDFSCFAAKDPSKPGESTIVVVEEAIVGVDAHMVYFRIRASHFLWRMVRRVTGVLVKVGKGDVKLEEMSQLLTGAASPRLDVAAWTAPASGLFLETVEYPPD